MRTLFQILLCGMFVLFSSTGCAKNTREEGLMKVRQLKAEDFFSNRNEIELVRAVDDENTNRIQEILNSGLNINVQGYRDGMTFIMWSLVRQRRDSYQYLLEHGADPNLKTTEGSIMDFAVGADDPFWLKLALEHGGDPNAPSGNQTIIFEAIRHQRNENVMLLIKAGADINYQNKITKDTPMMRALSRDRYDIMYLLLENGANPELNRDKIISFINKYKLNPYDEDYKIQQEYREKVIKLLESKGFKFE